MFCVAAAEAQNVVRARPRPLVVEHSDSDDDDDPVVLDAGEVAALNSPRRRERRKKQKKVQHTAAVILTQQQPFGLLFAFALFLKRGPNDPEVDAGHHTSPFQTNVHNARNLVCVVF